MLVNFIIILFENQMASEYNNNTLKKGVVGGVN